MKNMKSLAVMMLLGSISASVSDGQSDKFSLSASILKDEQKMDEAEEALFDMENKELKKNLAKGDQDPSQMDEDMTSLSTLNAYMKNIETEKIKPPAQPAKKQ